MGNVAVIILAISFLVCILGFIVLIRKQTKGVDWGKKPKDPWRKLKGGRY